MAYEKQNFLPGQKLTADQMNYIEDGIESAFGWEDSSVTYDRQYPTQAQKVQGAENLGVLPYYAINREDIQEAHNSVDSEYIWGLYDALMGLGNVKKLVWIEETKSWSAEWENYNPADGTFVNYQYVISTGAYNDIDGVFAPDEHIKKPKYLVLSGIHGDERVAALSLYRFICDVLNGYNIPPAFKEGVSLHVMPVGNPSGFDAFTRESAEGVDINRAFDSATPAKETQAISKWLSDNADADLFLDCHNGAIHEIVAIIGASNDDTTDMAKKIALQGIDRIIPYWKDVVGYPQSVESQYYDEGGNKTVGERNIIFSYSTTYSVEGSAIYYALITLGIPSLAAEMSVYYGNYSDWVAVDKKVYNPESIAAGAEAIGNILIEFYEESFFGEVVDDMKAIDNKLDILMEAVNSGFRMESGTITINDANIQDYFSNNTLRIPCPNGAKILIFQADSATVSAIKAYASTYWTLGLVANCLGAIGDTTSSFYVNRGYLCRMAPNSSGKYVPTEVGCAGDNADGFTTKMAALKTGTYNWTAYYWNE